MNDAAGAKRDAAERAAALVQSGMTIGLGTGSTASLAVAAIALRIVEGSLSDVKGVPTSSATERLARERGIPLTTLAEYSTLDMTIDGADEIAPDGSMIKGAGGALLREKIVATHSRRLVIVADATKLVERLGARMPLPVEVVAFGWSTHREALRDLGADSVALRKSGGEPVMTDEGHFTLDANFEGGIGNPPELARLLRLRPGVVETGLFLGFNPEVIVGRG